MAKCIVIGGGLAGISSAVHLQKLGHKVELIEASPKLGGRTYSFLDEKSNTEIDNGQHILMGLYTNTFELLDLFGTLENLKFQSTLEIELFRKKEEHFILKASNFIYPINLLIAIWRFDALSTKEKIGAVKFLSRIWLSKENKIKKVNALVWLKSHEQSDNSINSLWELICISALNTKLNESSAELFKSILKKIFFSGNKAGRMVLTNVPLSKIFTDPAKKYFDKHEIEFSTSERVVELSIENNRVDGIITDIREISDFDSVVLAIPHHAIEKLTSPFAILPVKFLNMETSPIITVHIWEKQNTVDKKFIGFLESPIHWLFRNKNHLSIVISAADDLLNLSSDEIIKIVVKELIKFIPNFSIENIVNYKVLKEKRATLKCTLENEKLRKSLKTKFSNMTFAGDWTNTDLPGTIEGAILSGKLASREINAKKKPILI